MARHLMAVCVVCLLCADHLPCKDHIGESGLGDTRKSVNGTDLQNDLSLRARTSDNSFNIDDNALRIKYQYVKRRGRTREDGGNRSKRHAHEAVQDERTYLNVNEYKNSKRFLKKLFEQFGDVNSMSMNVVGFEKMLDHLGLHSLIEEKLVKNENPHKHENAKTLNESCISSLDLVSRVTSGGPATTEHHHHHHTHDTKLITNGHSVSNQSLANDTEINGDKDTHDEDFKKNTYLDSSSMLAVCPILLYQLTAPTSHERSGCVYSSLITSEMDTKPEYVGESADLMAAWLYASLSVLGVSLVGLLGVAVIPCMDRHFYQHTIQFLVALAVGTLAGDALLHLLPHSMMSFASMEDGHTSMVWKGLIAVLGIVFFFATERGLTMIAEWRKKIEKKEKPSSRVRVMRDPDSGSVNNSTAGDKLCKHKYSSYPYCYDEIAMDTKDDHHHHHHHGDTANEKPKTDKSLTSSPVANNKNSIHNYRKSHELGDHNETAQSLLPHNYTTISDNYTVINKDDSATSDNNTMSTNLDDASIECQKNKNLVREETYTIILREHESSHHGHSHKHGHVHSPPRSLSAVAWMVVMGDGLHNFTDGMAIGAAFSNNIAGGFSTAIAVFCHELPHELGDFAVLLKAGMSAKQAVYYNLLSSVLSFIGMTIGIVIGHKPEASAWVFACAAGMFIYIALVDMMPELTSSHNERCALSQCLLQLLGMCCGLGIMLLIALYEHDLMNIFSSSEHAGHSHT